MSLFLIQEYPGPDRALLICVAWTASIHMFVKTFPPQLQTLPQYTGVEIAGHYPDIVEINLFKFWVIVLYPLQRLLYIC